MRPIQGIDLKECFGRLEAGEVLTGKEAAAVIASLFTEAIGGRYAQRTLYRRTGLDTTYEISLRKHFGGSVPIFRSDGDRVVSKRARSTVYGQVINNEG